MKEHETIPQRTWKYQREAARKRATKRSAGDSHEAIVQRYRERGAGTRNFPAAMRRLGVTSSIRPDAWFIREDRRHLELYEVVVCNNLDYGKCDAYKALFRDLERAGWTCAVTRVDRHGRETDAIPRILAKPTFEQANARYLARQPSPR